MIITNEKKLRKRMPIAPNIDNHFIVWSVRDRLSVVLFISEKEGCRRVLY